MKFIFLLIISAFAHAAVSIRPYSEYKNMSPDERYTDLKLRFVLHDYFAFGAHDRQLKNIRDEINILLEIVDGDKKKVLHLFSALLLIDENKYDLADKKLEPYLNQKSDFIRSRYYLLKGEIAHERNDFASAENYYKKGLALSKGIEKIIPLLNMSDLEIDRGNNNQAIEYIQEGFKEVNNYRKLEARLAFNLGKSYSRIGEMALALDNYFKALEIFKQEKDNYLITHTLNNIAITKKGLGKSIDELLYLKKAEKYFSDEVHPDLKALVLGNLFTYYSKNKDYLNSKKYYEKALKISESNKFLGDVIYLKSIFADEKIKMNRPQEGLKILESLQSIDSEHWTNFDKYYYDLYHSQAYFKLNKLNTAEKYFLKAESLLNGVGRADKEGKHYKYGVSLYNRMSNIQEEYKYYKKWRELKEKIIEEKAKKLLYTRENDLLKKDIELKDANIKVKESEKNLQLITGSGLLLFLILILGGLYYRNRKTKQVQNYIQTQVLARFLPPSIIDEIMKGKSRLDTEPTYEIVTVLFCDIVGFTKMFSTEDSKIATAVLNKYLLEITQVIYQYNGTIDKFIGDAVMVLFGAPIKISEEIQARRAVDCGKAMIAKVEELNSEFRDLYGINIQVRIGINQGTALVGTIGGEQRSDYTAIGHTVNVAARVESVAQPQQILFTKKIANQLLTPSKSEGEFSLKGVEDVVELYTLSQQDSLGRAS